MVVQERECVCMCVKSKYSVEGDAKQMSKQASNASSASNALSASNVVILQDYTSPYIDVFATLRPACSCGDIVLCLILYRSSSTSALTLSIDIHTFVFAIMVLGYTIV